MVKYLVLAALLAPALWPVSVAAEDSPVAGQTATSADPIGKPKLICQNEEVTGSRLGTHRTCLTAAQWQDYRRQLRLDVEHDQKLGMTGNGPISSNGKGGH